MKFLFSLRIYFSYNVYSMLETQRFLAGNRSLDYLDGQLEIGLQVYIKQTHQNCLSHMRTVEAFKDIFGQCLKNHFVWCPVKKLSLLRLYDRNIL